MGPALSIVIPARSDAEALARTLQALAGVDGIEGAEVIVAASGDPEGTRRAVGERGRLLWPAGSTRAELMNAGAAAAHGPILLFLHADTTLPRGALAMIAGALADARTVGGAFAHRFTERHASLAVISSINRMRYRLTGNYYGDQALFVRASVFRGLDGYARVSLMEDLDFSRRLKRRGRTVLLPVPVHTSGRRFLARGPWRTFALIVRLLLRYTLGLDTERYAELWRGPSSVAPGSRWPKPGRWLARAVATLLRRYARGQARAAAPHVLGRRVLDLGAGEGFVGPALAAATGVRVCSADVGAYRMAPGAYVLYDGRDLPFRDGTFDTTLLLLVLHHCADPAEVLDEALRVTRHRIIVMESVYRNGRDRFWLDLLDGRVNRLRHGGRMAPGTSFRTVPGWTALFRSRGLTVTAATWLGPWWERLVHHPALFVLDRDRRRDG